MPYRDLKPPYVVTMREQYISEELCLADDLAKAARMPTIGYLKTVLELVFDHTGHHCAPVNVSKDTTYPDPAKARDLVHVGQVVYDKDKAGFVFHEAIKGRKCSDAENA